MLLSRPNAFVSLTESGVDPTGERRGRGGQEVRARADRERDRVAERGPVDELQRRNEAIVARLERVLQRVLAEHEHVVVRASIDDRGRAGHAEVDAVGLAASVRDLTEPEGELRVILRLTRRIDVVHDVVGSLRRGGDRMGGRVGAEERVLAGTSARSR